MSTEFEFITYEKKDSLCLIGLNRPKARNAMNTKMLQEFALALTAFEDDRDSRCAVIFAHGKAFTLGLELDDVAATMRNGNAMLPEGALDPWEAGNGSNRVRTKPIVVAVHGFCLTLGIELLLACDVRLAAPSSRFAQVEVQRGIMPFGGATFRFVQSAGWGHAMKYMLTGDDFGAEEALRMGLVQEIVEKDRLLERAQEIARRIADQAPLAVQATIASARKAQIEGIAACKDSLLPETLRLMATEDAAEGVQSFVEKRKAVYKGK
ncbi:MAG: enoyl-CoA hydratase [Leptospiraceae bacterium]|nr:enoyl-CoA hydratase [Leptospiraceae bacterium]